MNKWKNEHLQSETYEKDENFEKYEGKNYLMIVRFIMPYDMGQWLELKRAMFQTLRTQRAVKLEALLEARTQCQTEYIAMMKT